ncbi:MAG: NAD-dependent epimerase/dehydratase family protein, partial [Tagaea sp.]|nr:NAD-dependent epimerase/dehydratase family protein [Tagaea sp.]
EADADRALAGADIAIHAAAATAGAGANVADPLALVVDNQVMNARVFAAAHRSGVKHVVWFSCSIMYASSERPRRESDYDPSAPLHPAYRGAGATKVYFERMADWYAGLGKTKFTALRHSNVYGPHDKYDLGRSHFFGATVTKVLTARDGRIELWGAGTEGRDLIHVDDLVGAVRAVVARQPGAFGLYNIGAGEAVPVGRIAERIVAASGRKLDVARDPAKPSIPVTIALDCARARAELGWAPAIALDEGIARTLAWWRAHRPTGEAPA